MKPRRSEDHLPSSRPPVSRSAASAPRKPLNPSSHSKPGTFHVAADLGSNCLITVIQCKMIFIILLRSFAVYGTYVCMLFLIGIINIYIPRDLVIYVI